MTKGLLLLIAGLCLAILIPQRQRKQNEPSNKPPVIKAFESSSATLTFCPGGREDMYCEPSNRKTVTLSVNAIDQEGEDLSYKYSVTAGEILGEGTPVTWKLTGQPIGIHIATVAVTDTHGNESVATVKVTIENCWVCGFPDPPCPLVALNSTDKVAHRGERLSVTVTVMPQEFRTRPDYNWTIYGGTVIKGDHTPMVEIEATGEIGRDLVATIDVDGFDLACSRRASLRIPIRP